jgi:hypothetical protein
VLTNAGVYNFKYRLPQYASERCVLVATAGTAAARTTVVAVAGADTHLSILDMLSTASTTSRLLLLLLEAVHRRAYTTHSHATADATRRYSFAPAKTLWT